MSVKELSLTPSQNLSMPLVQASKSGFGKLPKQVAEHILSFVDVQSYFRVKPTSRLLRDVKFLGIPKTFSIIETVNLFCNSPLEKGYLSRVRVAKLAMDVGRNDAYEPDKAALSRMGSAKVGAALTAIGKQCPALAHLGLDRANYDEYALIAKECRTVTRLDVQGVSYLLTAVEDVVKVLPLLQELWVYDPIILPSADHLAKIPQLRSVLIREADKIDLFRDSFVESVKIRGLSQATNRQVANLALLPHLKDLELGNLSQISDLSFMKGMTTLRTFHCRNFYGETNFKSMFATFLPPENLEEVAISDCSGFSDATLQSISRCAKLKKLSLDAITSSYTHSFGDKGLASLAACRDLEHLALCNFENKPMGWTITTQGVVDLARKLPKLRCLDLKYCMVPTVDAKSIEKALCETHPKLEILKPKN